MVDFEALDYFSYSVHGLLILAGAVVSVAMIPGCVKQRGEYCKIFSLLSTTAFNAALLAVYDLFLLRRLSGHLVCAVALAFMPVLLPGFSSGREKLALCLSVTVSLSTGLMFLLKGQMMMLLGRAGLWLMPPVMILSALLIMFDSVLTSTSDVTKLIISSSVLGSLEYRMDVIYFTVYLAVIIISSFIGIQPGWATASLSLMCLMALISLGVCRCWRLLSGKVFVLMREREQKILDSVRACSSGMPRSFEGADGTYTAVFERLKTYFESESPFLDPTLNISDVAHKLFTNKVYLSRAISQYTGRNFCQFVNYHRIRYAVRLYDLDQNLKVADLAERSGFRTVNSFNMAFRLYMNTTPGEWCKKNRHAKII